jgi:surface polysaccharide O-acyltransferase-like enzyme
VRLDYEPGHLWFLQALILFAVIYAIFRALTASGTENNFRLYPDRFPPDAILLLSIGILTILSFAVRLVFPVGVWFLSVQPGHFVHYTFAFYVGVLAYRGDWFRRLSAAQARRWGKISLVVIPFFFVLAILGGVLEDDRNVDKFLGGLGWQAFSYALWESLLMVGIILFLLYFFRERLFKAGPTAKAMAANVYTVYIIHQTILIGLNLLFLSIQIPTIVKFVLVSSIVVPACFLLSALIRRIPYTRRVLG